MPEVLKSSFRNFSGLKSLLLLLLTRKMVMRWLTVKCLSHLPAPHHYHHHHIFLLLFLSTTESVSSTSISSVTVSSITDSFAPSSTSSSPFNNQIVSNLSTGSFSVGESPLTSFLPTSPLKIKMTNSPNRSRSKSLVSPKHRSSSSVPRKSRYRSRDGRTYHVVSNAELSETDSNVSPPPCSPISVTGVSLPSNV